MSMFHDEITHYHNQEQFRLHNSNWPEKEKDYIIQWPVYTHFLKKETGVIYLKFNRGNS